MDIARIADYIAICELKARYCRALDTKDWAGYADVFTEDLELDTRPAGGTLSHGRDESVRIVRSSIETAITAHQVHSPEITIDGDVAHGVWALQDRVIWQTRGMTGFGHYHERYVRHDGRWRIAATKLTRLHTDWD